MTQTAFVSAGELAAHLRELVDDEDFITRTVRVHFPAYKDEVRANAKAQAAARAAHQRSLVRGLIEARCQPRSEQRGAIAFEVMHPIRMEQGSRELLLALWDRHRGILAHFAANGARVVRPEQLNTKGN